MNRSNALISASFLLVLIFVFGGMEWKNNLMAVFNNPLGWWRNKDELQSLRLENASLRAQVAEISNNITPFKSDSLGAKVFSSYPFNNKNILSINVGTEQGVEEGMPVVVGDQILVGQITQAFKNYSLVRTLFSPDWELPVRIGDKKVPALLIGGPELSLTMIVNDKPIFEGQDIFLAKQDLPYGLKVGEVVNVKKDSATGVFQEAGIRLDYDLNDITDLSVFLWTAD